MSVGGRARSQTQVRKFYLYDALGEQQAVFGAPQIDQERGEIFFPSENSTTIAGLYSRGDKTFETLFRDGKRLIFNEDSPHLQKEIVNGEAIIYEYDGNDLVRVRKGNQWIELQYQNGVIVSARTSDGRTRRYEYEANGALKRDSGVSRERQLEIVDASGQTIRARLNSEANILSIDRQYQPSAATQKLWQEIFNKEKESINELLAASDENVSAHKVFDLGPKGYVVFSENRLHFLANSINELKASLKLAFEDATVSSEELQALHAIFGRNAQNLSGKNVILTSQDHELDLWAASYFRRHGKTAYVDDRLAIAVDNLKAQKALNKSRPGLLADEESFRDHPQRARLQESSERIKEAFRGRGLNEVSSTFAQIPRESNLVIITAENDGELSRKLEQAGSKLTGKHVIVFSCGDMSNLTSMPEAAHRLIANHNSLGVMSFYQKIDVAAAEAVIKELVLAAQESPFETVETLMDRAIIKAKEAAKENEELRKNISKLEKRWHQISMNGARAFQNNILVAKRFVNAPRHLCRAPILSRHKCRGTILTRSEYNGIG